MECKNVSLVSTTLEHINDIIDFESKFEHPTISKESLAHDIASTDYYYVSAIYNNKVIGYAGIHILVDHVDVITVAVDKEFQNIGIGKMLLSNIIEKALDLSINEIFLEVRISNINAIKLYESFGFVKISERKNYYTDEIGNFENAAVYIKK